MADAVPKESEVPCIQLEAIGVVYQTKRGPVEAALDVNLTMDEGEFVALLGPTGCGKSTLLRVIGDLVAPTSGQIQVWGQPACVARQRNEFGMVFQEPALMPWRTALENVRLPLEIVDFPVSQAETRCMELLRRVGLEKFVGNYPHELSGGMKQRVAISRALAWGPSIMLMDEPFSALDELTKIQLQDDLLDLWAEEKKTIVFVTHNVPEAVYLADRIVVMTSHPGKISKVIQVELPRPRAADIRETTDFAKHIRLTREALRQ